MEDPPVKIKSNFKMIATESPGIILEKIKRNVIFIPTLPGKNDFRICMHASSFAAERKEDLNDLSVYFVEIPYTFTLKESSL